MRRPRRPVRTDGPLRVLFVVPTLAVGGAERHATTLLTGMDTDRVAGSLVALQTGGIGTNWDVLRAAGVPAVELRRGRRDLLGMLVDLVAHLRRERPDVVVLRGFNAETLGRLAGVLARVPRLAVWVHNCGDVTPHGRGRRTVDAALARVTDAVYGVAHAQLPYITGELGHDAAKVRIVHNGTDLGWTTPDPTGERDTDLARELGLADDETVIGTAAVMRPEKDQSTLIRAFRLLVDDRPRTRLVLAGHGRERPRLEALVDELGLRERVLFLGHRDDVPRLLRVFDVFTLSSRTVECFPMSVLEAMSAGLPAVCTDVGGVAEMVADGETGFVVPAEDPAALAAAFRTIVDDPQRARRMGLAGRRRVREEFTLRRSIDGAQAAIEETAGRTAPHTDALPARR